MQPVSTWILPPYFAGLRSMKLPAPAMNSGAGAGELLEDEALAALAAGLEAGERDVEVDAGVGGDERVLLGEPAAGAVELDRPHLAGQRAGEGDQAAAADGREVLERQALAGQHPLADLHADRHRLGEEATATAGAAGRATRAGRGCSAWTAGSPSRR